MKKVSLTVLFFLALAMAVFLTALFSKVKLIPFAPFLVFAVLRQPFAAMLRSALLCGICMDILTIQFRFGIHALGYCLAGLTAYAFRRYFFEDKPIAIALFTAWISAALTMIELMLSWAFDQGIPIRWNVIATDICLLPFADGLYALVGFVLPVYAYQSGLFKKIFLTILSKKRRS